MTLLSVQHAPAGILSRLALRASGTVAALAARRNRARTRKLLANLSDSQLHDIGLIRGDINKF